MHGIIQPWCMAIDPGTRHRLMGVAGYCVGEFGGRSPIGRAIRQVMFSKAVRPNDVDMDSAEWLAWCDRIVAAMPVMPYRALTALYTVAAILEKSMPAESIVSGWESLAAQRECWAALRRAIDEHQSTLPAGCVVAELTDCGCPGPDDDDPEADADIDRVLSAIIIMVRHGATPGVTDDDPPVADAV
jgi:hypothetical protein